MRFVNLAFGSGYAPKSVSSRAVNPQSSIARWISSIFSRFSVVGKVGVKP